mmetsp:Transcript_77675/g.122380  ORF Transcript_77675/g.122380 Transcript_77675/m.122380 type:complete len:340 (-) Transcript_77675:39-1058(-)
MILPIIPATTIYPTVCALSFCMGLVHVLSESAASAWTITSVAPDERTNAMGILLRTRSAAGMIAPALGGTLYGLGGFCLPIIAGGAIFATMLIMKRKSINAEMKTIDTVGSKGSVLKSKRVCICQFINFVVMLSLCSCAIFFQTHLEFSYGVPSWKYGIIASCFSLIFIGGAVVAARMERAFGTKIPLILGSASMSVGLLLFGPAPFLTFLPSPEPASAWLPCLSLAMFFFGFSQVVSMLSPMALNYAVRDGWSDNDAAAQNATINAVFGGCSVGVGASFGGILVDAMGVGATASIFAAALPTLVALALACLSVCDMDRCSQPCTSATVWPRGKHSKHL